MTIVGTIIAIVVALLVTIFLGPYGILVLIAIIFGLVLSTHIRNKEIHSDLQRIKEKLGIEDKDDFNMRNEEIEEELEDELESDERIDNDLNELTELDKEIEKELEAYIESDDKDNKDTKEPK